MTQIRCPVCSEPLAVRLARGRKSGKPFVMLLCANDGRHIRAFVSDKEFVNGVVEKAGVRAAGPEPGGNGSTGTEGEEAHG